MSIANTLRKAADLYETAVEALQVISKLTKTTKDDKAVEVLKVVAIAVDTALAGFDGKVTTKDVNAALAKLKDSIKENDDKADQALHDKFDVSTVK